MADIIITAGDPLGIGPEVLVKALNKLPAAALKRIAVIGEQSSLIQAGFKGQCEFIPVASKYKKTLKRGPSKYGGDISYQALDYAVKQILKGKYKALVTAPISKEAWAMCGIKFTGHTEMLRKHAAAQGALMMFSSGKINCALVSEHYPVSKLGKVITQKRIMESFSIFTDVLGKDASIALSSLNPHAGDGGKIGFEEIKTIIPVVKSLKKAGYNISGPLPCDSLWPKHLKGQYKGILCMYHDQALLGLKLAAKEPVVHITAGLKFLRTSPTHGTAFDIAGQNKADGASMLAAIKYALKKTALSKNLLP